MIAYDYGRLLWGAEKAGQEIVIQTSCTDQEKERICLNLQVTSDSAIFATMFSFFQPSTTFSLASDSILVLRDFLINGDGMNCWMSLGTRIK